MHLNRILAGLLILSSAGLLQAAAPRAVEPNGNLPGLALGRVLPGQEAIQVLGERLPDVAVANRMTAEELRRVLTEDRASYLDREGRLFYADADLSTLGHGAIPAETETLAEASIPIDQTFKLHSRPGATRVIYLDFDGHYLSGTAWNANFQRGAPIPAPAWDIDGNQASFGASECTLIQNVWKRVAEDYAPFNVDVTTEYPGEAALTRSTSTDGAYGMRILISPISTYFGKYGGIAYVGSFDDVGDYYKPALVFPENLANGEKYIGEACSHECGHTLGLSHDGTTTGTEYYSGHGSGETGWAPIMGVGYYQNLTQWSKGGYASANNTQDDLAIIAGYVGYEVDDFGSDNSTAVALGAGPQVLAEGDIERNTDRDVFKFTTGAGTVSFSVTAADLGPNLDVVASLYDTAGNLLATSSPVEVLGATLSVGLNAGTYFIHVSSTGTGDPFNGGYDRYGSLGQYTLTGTIVAATGAIPPTAVASATPTSGTAPLVVQFSSAASSDPDGAITSWLWTFGDGTSSSEANPTHTYATAGTYTATLTVWDNTGLSGSATTQVKVSNPAVETIVRVETILLSSSTAGSGKTVIARVRVTDMNNVAVSGAYVSGSWGGVATGSSSGTTDSNGWVTLNSRRTKRSGPATFTVTGVNKAGTRYDSSANLMTSTSINL